MGPKKLLTPRKKHEEEKWKKKRQKGKLGKTTSLKTLKRENERKRQDEKTKLAEEFSSIGELDSGKEFNTPTVSMEEKLKIDHSPLPSTSGLGLVEPSLQPTVGIVVEEHNESFVIQPTAIQQSITKNVKQLMAKSVEHLQIASNVAKQSVKQPNSGTQKSARNVEQSMDKHVVNEETDEEPMILPNTKLKKNQTTKKPMKMPIIEKNLRDKSMVQRIFKVKNMTIEKPKEQPIAELDAKNKLNEEHYNRPTSKQVEQSITKNVKQLITKNMVHRIARNVEQPMDKHVVDQETDEEPTIQPNTKLKINQATKDSMKTPIVEKKLTNKPMVQRIFKVKNERMEKPKEQHIAELDAKNKLVEKRLNPPTSKQVEQSITKNVKQLITKNKANQIARKVEQPMDKHVVNKETDEDPMIQPNTKLKKNQATKEPIKKPIAINLAGKKLIDKPMVPQIVKVKNVPIEKPLEQPVSKLDEENNLMEEHLNQPAANQEQSITKNIKQLISKTMVKQIARNVEQPNSKHVTNKEIDVKRMIQLNAELMENKATEKSKEAPMEDQPNVELMVNKPTKEPLKPLIELQVDEKLSEELLVPQIFEGKNVSTDKPVEHLIAKDLNNQLPEEPSQQPTAKQLKQSFTENASQLIAKTVAKDIVRNVTVKQVEEPTIQPNAEPMESEAAKEPLKPRIDIHIEEPLVRRFVKVKTHQSTEYPLNQPAAEQEKQLITKTVESVVREHMIKPNVDVLGHEPIEEAMKNPVGTFAKIELIGVPLVQQVAKDEDEPIERTLEQSIATNVKQSVARIKRIEERKELATEFSLVGEFGLTEGETLVDSKAKMDSSSTHSTLDHGFSNASFQLDGKHELIKEHIKNPVIQPISDVKKQPIEQFVKQPEARNAAIQPIEAPVKHLIAEQAKKYFKELISQQIVELKSRRTKRPVKKHPESKLVTSHQPIPGPSREGRRQPSLFMVSNYKEKGWIAAVFNDVWYPGMVEKINEDGTILVNFLSRCSENQLFVWPPVPERRTLRREDLLYVLDKPPVQVKPKFYKLEEYSHIEWLSKPLDYGNLPF